MQKTIIMRGSVIKIVLIALASVATLAGCAHGFHKEALKDQIGVKHPVFDDKDIKEAFKKKPNLPKPFTLAVYFKTPGALEHSESEWRWTEEDKKIFDGLATELKKQKIVSDVFPIISSVVQDEDLKSVRLAAAKHHADALLIISGAGQIDHYINGWGWSYILLLPTLFVPGSVADTLFITNATLWDVRNEYLYLTAETESEVKHTYVAAFGKQEKDLFNEAKTNALTSLDEELKKMAVGTKL